MSGFVLVGIISIIYTAFVFTIYGMLVLLEQKIKPIFGAPPGPDIRVSDLVLINTPPVDETVKWHPVLTHIPVCGLVSLSHLDGSIGLVVGRGKPIKTVPYPSDMFDIPKFVESVNILSADGELWVDVPILTLRVVARKEDVEEKTG